MNALPLTVIAALLARAAGTAQARNLGDRHKDHATAGNVLACGMGFDLKRHSPLSQITRDAIGRLVPVWSCSVAEPCPPRISEGLRASDLDHTS